MPKKTTRPTPTPIDSFKHDDRRANIPTEELRGFVADQEDAPPALLYPRDPSLDPQLVWKGKDAQDRDGLVVPVVPVYIQEKIHPEAIIEDFVRQARKAGGRGSGGAGGIGEKEPYYQLNLFADFNGFDDAAPGKRLDFYSHDDGSRPHWSNRMILGDSLLVMTSLAEKEGLKGRVQMIYIDPPYGIKFGSNWQVSTRKRDVKDGSADHLTRQPEQVKAFRDTWQLGIHSYLSYLRDRLTVARVLLTETGSVFVQIGDENVHLVRAVMDEVFGSENHISLITFATTSGFESNELARGGDYILWYAKNRSAPVKYRRLLENAEKTVGDNGYRWVMFPDGVFRGMSSKEVEGVAAIPDGVRVYKPDNILSQGKATQDQKFQFHGRVYEPGRNSHWKAHFPIGMERLSKANRIHIARNSIQYVRYAEDYGLKSRTNIWTDTLTGQFTDDKIYVVQTNTKVIERCLLMTTDPGDLVLDPTCGSGTTATVAEQWGRRWITIDTSRVALALARARLMSARYPWYHLAADHPNLPPTATPPETEFLLRNSVSKAAVSNVPKPETESFGKDSVSKGFVYRRVPHITLKSIANNPEIDAIHDRWQPRLDALRAEINRETEFLPRNSVSGAGWEEWEIPREAEEKALSALLARWWATRRERQAEIDDAIARHADTETLYDRPYEDRARLRVAGPFTVESLSPHRTLETEFLPRNSVTIFALLTRRRAR